jgi:hypothetical protein
MTEKVTRDVRRQPGHRKHKSDRASWWTRWAAVAGALVAIIGVPTALIKLWDPIHKALTGEQQEQSATFDQATSLLNQVARSERLNGLSKLIVLLRSQDSDLRRRVLLVLANFVATEKEAEVQAAVRDSFGMLAESKKLDPDDWTYFQGRLIEISRSLSKSGNLYERREHLLPSGPPSQEEFSARYVRDILVDNIRRGTANSINDYSKVYCVDCDFSGTNWQPGVNFAGAILDDSNFSRATLKRAIFDNAELAGSRFVEADLTAASFRSVNPPTQPPYAAHTPYVEHALAALKTEGSVLLVMPNFSCANLAFADFDGHTLFAAPFLATRTYVHGSSTPEPAWSSALPQVCQMVKGPTPCTFPALTVEPTKFFRATLTNTKLNTVQFIAIGPKEPFYRNFSVAVVGSAVEFNVWEGRLVESAWNLDSTPILPGTRVDDERLLAMLFQTAFRGALYEALWDPNSFPIEIQKFLQNSHPTQQDYRVNYLSPFLSGKEQGDRDATCVPRKD